MPPSTAIDLHVPFEGWLAFNALVVGLLLLDLLGFNRQAHHIGVREAARLSGFFIGVAVAVGVVIWWIYGSAAGVTYFTGYLVEESLSVDNLFVIAVIFSYFSVPAIYQHRVLFWGIFGAIVMRGVMILVGVELVDRFHWILYVFGGFLVLTGLRMLLASDKAPDDPRDNPILKLLRRVLPVTDTIEGPHFLVRHGGKLFVTPLFLVLVLIELTDVVFAFDSIPAILGITRDPFLAYASNIMAVLGLRALFFLLVGVIESLRFLHVGLSLVLLFIGGKMLVEHWVHVPVLASLAVIVVCIGGSALASWYVARQEQG